MILNNHKNLIATLFLCLSTFFGCVRYATQDEKKFLKNFENNVYSLEAEVKELKFQQIKLINEKNNLIRLLENCRAIKDSIQVDTVLSDEK